MRSAILKTTNFFLLCRKKMWSGFVGIYNIYLSKDLRYLYQTIIVKTCSQNIAKVERKFYILRIGQFRRFWRQRTQNICEIMWVFNKTIWNENSDPQYHGIMEYIRFYENAWLGFRNYTFLHLFWIHLHSSLHCIGIAQMAKF